MAYDEEAEVTRYVWDHFASLLTDFERAVNAAGVGRQKAAAADRPTVVRLVNETWGRAGDPDIEAALADGADAFRRRACRRVLAEHGDKVFINRCPRCRRVVRTPRAAQCFWCGFDWHDNK